MSTKLAFVAVVAVICLVAGLLLQPGRRGTEWKLTATPLEIFKEIGHSGTKPQSKRDILRKAEYVEELVEMRRKHYGLRNTNTLEVLLFAALGFAEGGDGEKARKMVNEFMEAAPHAYPSDLLEGRMHNVEMVLTAAKETGLKGTPVQEGILAQLPTRGDAFKAARQVLIEQMKERLGEQGHEIVEKMIADGTIDAQAQKAVELAYPNQQRDSNMKSFLDAVRRGGLAAEGRSTEEVEAVVEGRKEYVPPTNRISSRATEISIHKSVTEWAKTNDLMLMAASNGVAHSKQAPLEVDLGGWFANQYSGLTDKFETGYLWSDFSRQEGIEIPITANGGDTQEIARVVLNLHNFGLTRELKLHAAMKTSGSSAKERETLWRKTVELALVQARIGDLVDAAVSTNGSPVSKVLRLQETRADTERFNDLLTEVRTARENLIQKNSLSGIQPIEPISITTNLPPRHQLVEYIRFSPGNEPGGTLVDHYGAVVLERGEKPRWVDLGKADETDALIGRYYAAIEMDERADSNVLDQVQTDFVRISEELYRRVWKPLKLSEITKVVLVSPDSALHRVPFGVLFENKTPVCSKYAVRLVTSGRDLVVTSIPGRKGGAIEIWSDIPYGAEDIGRKPKTAAEYRLAGLELLPLAHSADEASRIERVAKENNYSPKMVQGIQATEGRFWATKDPYILHLSTHGRSIPPPPIGGGSLLHETVRDRFRQELAFLRCALALANAREGQKRWSYEKASAPLEDGLMTGAEVLRMDLRGTWLVCLSACETAKGTTSDGEGVRSLRQAFEIAGARNVVSALWSTNDRESGSFFELFYSELFKTEDAAIALQNATKQKLQNAMHAPANIWTMIKLYGGFVASGRP